MTDLSVVVVNYHSAEQTLAALASVRSQTHTHGYELIVVDNDEDGGGGARIRREAPDVRVISSGGNVGFGIGCNAGMAAANGRWLLLLNPDTQIVDGAVDRCLEYLDRLEDPAIAMLGCEHVDADGSLQISSYPAGIWPSLFATLANNPFLRGIARLLRPEFFAEKSIEAQRARHRATHETDAIQGSFMLVRPDVVRATGGFDPDFFLYFEELDWCRRIRERGDRILYYRDARIVHATRRRHDDPETERQAYLSEALFVLKREGRFACAVHVLFRHLNVALATLLSPLLSQESRASLREHRRLLGFGRSDWLRPLFDYAPSFRSGTRSLRTGSLE
jgi:GT2 family glycosyltransferase